MRIIQLVAAFLLGAANVAVSADSDLQQLLSRKLKAIIPDAEITSVKPAPLPGLYEVMLGATVLYMTGDGRFALRGDILDLNAKANLTNIRRSEARTVAFHKQDNTAIEFSATGGKSLHTLYVFTDIDCGYCRKMHQEVAQLNAAGITIKYLAFPRTGLEGDSYRKAVSVWCAVDQKQALTDAKNGKDLGQGSCVNPVAAQYQLGQEVGVHGTPAVFLDDGQELGGYVPAAELIRMLKSGDI
ncbi:MAG: DsbC family protein [Gammaproteobacteria bacterium]|nr:DsbC family protein [Gammaproteobacteria bacterium]